MNSCRLNHLQMGISKYQATGENNMKKLLIGAIALLLVAMIVILVVNIGQDESKEEDELAEIEQYELENFTDNERSALDLARDRDRYNWSRKHILETIVDWPKESRDDWDISEEDGEALLDYLDFDFKENALITTKLALVGFGYSEETMHLLLTEYRGFTEEEAEYAIDNLDERDWNSDPEYFDELPITVDEKNIARDAERHSRLNNLSKVEIEDLSEFRDYSDEEIEVGLEYARIDYNFNALKRAEEYLKESDYSTEELHELLIETHGFTQEEANYAIENLDD